jgi:GxxExxY protein
MKEYGTPGSQEARDAREPEEPGAGIDAVASATLHAAIKLTDRGIRFVRQPTVAVVYKQRLVGDSRPDLLVDGCSVVELKAVDHIAPVHLAHATST